MAIYDGIFDTHAHYDDDRFTPDREAVITGLREKGVWRVLNAGSDMDNSYAARDLADKYDFFCFSAGIHPHEAKSFTPECLVKLTELTKHPKCVAIGEIGLDFHYDLSPRDVQREAFREQLLLANKLLKPVIIHSREACAETLSIVKENPPAGGVVHCFSGSIETMREYMKLGMYVGFTGVVTFKNAARVLEVVRETPLERILIETDSPYMAPEPYRGQRCDSSMLWSVCERLAAVKGISAEEFVRVTRENGERAFGLV